jgi:hypothetical protein
MTATLGRKVNLDMDENNARFTLWMMQQSIISEIKF